MPEASFQWSVAPADVFPAGFRAYMGRLEQLGRQIGETRSQEITAGMKSHHLWQNRTGAAEAGLHTTARQEMPVILELTLSHGADVPYGIWLELAHGGRFAIIAPSVDYWGPRIMEDFKFALARAGTG